MRNFAPHLDRPQPDRPLPGPPLPGPPPPRPLLPWTAQHFSGTALTRTATKPHANVPQPTLVEHGRAHELDAIVFFFECCIRMGFFRLFFFFEVGPGRYAALQDGL